MNNTLWRFHTIRWIFCEAETTRNGESVPCDVLAVSATLDPDGDTWYPTCAHHTRKATAVPIRELLFEAWREGHQATPNASNPYDGDPS